MQREEKFSHHLEEPVLRKIRVRKAELALRAVDEAHTPDVESGPFRRRTSRWRRVALAAVVLCIAGLGLLAVIPASARLQQVMCLIPGLGIRVCGEPGLAAAKPVSVSENGAQLTVVALLSSGGQTLLRIDITGLSSAVRQLAPGRLRITIRDSTGKEYAPQDGWATWVRPEDPGTVSATAVFMALDPRVRIVYVRVDEPSPVGVWSVGVPVVPTDPSRFPLAQGDSQGSTVQGITVRIANVAVTPERTVVQLTAESRVAGHGVANLANHDPVVQPLILRDNQGRQYKEVSESQEALPRGQPGFTEDVSFPPLAAAARSVSIMLPFVTEFEETPPTEIRIPVTGKAIGDQIPVKSGFMLGSYPFRVVGAGLSSQPPGVPGALAAQVGATWLTLQMDYGDWNAGKKLVGPGVVENIHAAESSPHGDVGQFTYVSVPLPKGAEGEATITLQNARVAIRGPWHVEASLPAGR